MRIRSFIRNSLKYDEKDVVVSIGLKVEDAIILIKEQMGVGHVHTNQLALYIDSTNSTDQSIELKDLGSKLSDLGIMEESILSLRYSGGDSGLDSCNSICFAYAGPIIVFILITTRYGLQNLYPTQIIALFLSNTHYIRRILETSVDIKGSQKMPLFGVFGVVFYYWFLYGYMVGNYIFNESFESGTHPIIKAFCIFGFFYSELKNYGCHNILRKLKIVNKGKRAIPTGSTFELVSCANYFWEILSWLSFAVLVNTLTAYLFVLYSVLSMSSLALEKHRTYQNNFAGYPKNRKAIIPYLL